MAVERAGYLEGLDGRITTGGSAYCDYIKQNLPLV
jgi:hypothetical protein